MTRAVIICGSRDWTDPLAIGNVLMHLPHGTVVITGGAPGADRIAALGCRAYSDTLQSVVMHANWNLHGRAAGPIRNREMLDYLLTFDERHVYAFRSHPGSRGTNNMIEQARRAGVTVTVIDA